MNVKGRLYRLLCRWVGHVDIRGGRCWYCSEGWRY